MPLLVLKALFAVVFNADQSGTYAWIAGPHFLLMVRIANTILVRKLPYHLSLTDSLSGLNP
jgi:hypothetical protein